jgi:hypothetical protein
MRSPWVIGILSVVPGLGLLILGRVIPGLAAIAFMAVAGILASLAPSGTISQVVLAVAFIVWVVQGYYAVVIAQRTARSEAGDSLAEREVSIAPPPQGASLAERRAYEARKAVLQLLPPGQQLRVAIHGSTDTTPIALALLDLATGAPSQGQEIRQLYVAVTDHDLILVKIDPFGKPSHLQRIPLAQVKLSEFKQGMLSDVLAFDIGAAQPLSIGVARMMRQWTQELANLLSG